MAQEKLTKNSTKKVVAPKKAVKIAAPKVTKTKASGFSVPVFSLTGVKSGDLNLPEEIFGSKVNNGLIAQAIRVYTTNLKGHWSHTKTRGEVQGSTRKIYKQKGTGRARHGSIMAPIFVGGGIALGPKSRKTTLDLPKKMKSKALISALSLKLFEKSIAAIDDLSKTTGKTKQMSTLLQILSTALHPDVKKTGSLLIVVGSDGENALRATKNLKGISLMSADQINAYEVIKHQSLILTKDAVEKLEQRLTTKSEGEQKDVK